MRAPSLLAMLVLTLACARKQDPPPAPPVAPAPAPTVLAVKSLTLGRSLGADQKVADATDTFGVRDPFYASVETAGAAAKARLEATWTFAGPKGPVQVARTALDLANPAGFQRHAFHAVKPSGWARGDYQVEILLDGVPVAKQGFRVK